MAPREDSAGPATSAAAAATFGQALRDGGRENAGCLACRDVDTACNSSCRHCFCRLCLWDWSLGSTVCPQCRRPTRHLYPQHVSLYHEVQDQVYDRKRRRLSGSPAGRGGRSGSPERGRRKAARWHRDGQGGSWDGHGSSSSRRTRRRRRRMMRMMRRVRQQWDRDGDNAPGERRQAPRSEGDAAGSSWGSQRTRSREQQERIQGQRSSHGERSQGWHRQSHGPGQDTQTRAQGTEPQEGSARQRHWRWRRNVDEERAPRHPRDTPSASGRRWGRRRTR